MTKKSTFDASEQKLIKTLCYKLTGATFIASFNTSVLWINVRKRMQVNGFHNLRHYLQYASSTSEEFGFLVSALTIHTTRWFREPSHFQYLEIYLKKNIAYYCAHSPFKVLCHACSTGEEVYSIAMLLNTVKQEFPNFSFTIEGHDIDPISIQHAKKATYLIKSKSQIPTHFQNYISINNEQKRFSITNELRENCHFMVNDMLQRPTPSSTNYELILCRNALIYFNHENVNTIFINLCKQLNQHGLLILGHSEVIDSLPSGIRTIGHASYIHVDNPVIGNFHFGEARRTPRNEGRNPHSENTHNRVQTLIIDDEPLIRTLIQQRLEEIGIKAMTAESCQQALALMRDHAIKLIFCDQTMPGMHGTELFKIIKKKSPRPYFAMITANAKDIDVLINLHDFDHLFLKPIDFSALLAYAKHVIHEGQPENLQTPVIRAKTLQKQANSTDLNLKQNREDSNRLHRNRFTKVLIVDGDRKNATELALLIEKKNITVQVVTHSREAKQLLRSTTFFTAFINSHLPDCDGIDFAKEVASRWHTPVTLVSSAPSSAIMARKTLGISNFLYNPFNESQVTEIVRTMELAYHARSDLKKNGVTIKKVPDCILIGSSTGGVEALDIVLIDLPSTTPPIIVVQHIPNRYAKEFRKGLAETSGLKLGEIGEPLKSGTIYTANNDYHLELKKINDTLIVQPSNAPPIKGHRPSIDLLFKSAATCPSLEVAAFLLTGMGEDGANGLLDLRSNSATTFAQEACSCVVFGMPKKAISIGAARYVATPDEMRQALFDLIFFKKNKTPSVA